MPSKYNKNFNYYLFHNMINKILFGLSLIISMLVGYFVDNIFIKVSIYITDVMIVIIIYYIYYVAKPINKKDLKCKYVYHCISKEKYNIAVRDKEVSLLKTTEKLHNISTLFKNAVYFHSNLRGFGYLFNHGYKYRKISYVLIIPVKNLSNNLLMRKVDGAVADLNDYFGKAKCIPISKFNIYKIIDKKYIPSILRDYLMSVMFFNAVFMPFIFVIIKLYHYLGII